MIADDALGDPVDLDPGQPRDDAAHALGVEVLVRRAPVVAGGQRDVQRLVEGVLAGLAGLPADQVDDLVLAVEDQVVQPQQRAARSSSVVRGPAPPGPGGPARNASSTSASLDCGTCASGWPLIGRAHLGASRPVVATQPVGQGRGVRRSSA